jgi:hypothetical protein
MIITDATKEVLTAVAGFGAVIVAILGRRKQRVDVEEVMARTLGSIIDSLRKRIAELEEEIEVLKKRIRGYEKRIQELIGGKQ